MSRPDDAPGYTKELPVGGEQFTESLAANLGISRDEAEAVKLGVPSDEVAGLVNAPVRGVRGEGEPRLGPGRDAERRDRLAPGCL